MRLNDDLFFYRKHGSKSVLKKHDCYECSKARGKDKDIGLREDIPFVMAIAPNHLKTDPKGRIDSIRFRAVCSGDHIVEWQNNIKLSVVLDEGHFFL